MNLDPRAIPVLTRLGLIVSGDGRAQRPLAAPLHGPALVSINPANGRALGNVDTVTAADVDTLVASAAEAARRWRDTPAPQRGAALRRYADLLREHKDALGTLVTLENGKIKAEGGGAVQEMIDI